MRSRLLLEYDGSGFAGWAVQPGKRTVQAEVERALSVVLREDAVPVTVAGRTDRGVHAWGQVCSYSHEAVDPRRLNGLLPPDVAVLDCRPAHPDFDARQSAVSRTYCYRVHVRRTRSALRPNHALWWPGKLDVDALHACAAAVVGRHDFTAFTPSQTVHQWFHRHVLAACWEEGGEFLEFQITADAFLRSMNRILVGTMLEVAGGRRTVENFVGLLAGAPRAQAGVTALPHGLALASVDYADQAGA